VEEFLPRLSVSELLALRPAESWVEVDERWELEPVSAELQRRVEERRLSDDAWREILLACDMVHTRARWPAGERLAVWIQEPAWLRRLQITLRADDPPLGVVRMTNAVSSKYCGMARMDQLTRQRELLLDPLPRGLSEILCTVTLDQVPNDVVGSWPMRKDHRLWKGPLVLPIRAVDDLEEVLPSSDTSAEARAVRASLSADFSWGWTAHVSFRIDGRHRTKPPLAGLGLALDAEIRSAERTIGPLPTFRCSSFAKGRESETVGVSEDFRFPNEWMPDMASTARWTVKVSGRKDKALLTEWEADRSWRGSIEIPLDEALARGRGR
jgi:hypothetical protein